MTSAWITLPRSARVASVVCAETAGIQTSRFCATSVIKPTIWVRGEREEVGRGDDGEGNSALFNIKIIFRLLRRTSG